MLDINHPKQAINYLAVKIPGMNHSLSHTMFTQQFDLAKYPCLSLKSGGLHIGCNTYVLFTVTVCFRFQGSTCKHNNNHRYIGWNEAISIVLIMISQIPKKFL